MKFTKKELDAMLTGIENGTIDEKNLPENYYDALREYLSKAVVKGFGKSLANVSYTSENTLKELLFNVNHFAAAKTYAQTVEITKLLVDDEGVLRSSREFNKLAKELYSTWNDNYGRTEYVTTIGASDMAAKWQDIQANKGIVPNLRYSATGDACAICAPLDGLTAPVDDEIWDTIYPLNHFGCFCTVLQVDDDVTMDTAETLKDVTDKMDDSFKNNVGKTGEIFTKEHPYFDAPQNVRDNNFGLPMPPEVIPND